MIPDRLVERQGSQDKPPSFQRGTSFKSTSKPRARWSPLRGTRSPQTGWLLIRELVWRKWSRKLKIISKSLSKKEKSTWKMMELNRLQNRVASKKRQTCTLSKEILAHDLMKSTLNWESVTLKLRTNLRCSLLTWPVYRYQDQAAKCLVAKSLWTTLCLNSRISTRCPQSQDVQI